MSIIVTPSSLAEKILKKNGKDKQASNKIATAFFNYIKSKLHTQDSITISEFGTFKKILVKKSITEFNGKSKIILQYRIRYTAFKSTVSKNKNLNNFFDTSNEKFSRYTEKQTTQLKNNSITESKKSHQVELEELKIKLNSESELKTKNFKTEQNKFETDFEIDFETDKKSNYKLVGAAIVGAIIFVLVLTFSFIKLTNSESQAKTSSQIQVSKATQSAVQPKPTQTNQTEQLKSEEKTHAISENVNSNSKSSTTKIQNNSTFTNTKPVATVTVTRASSNGKQGSEFTIPTDACYHAIARQEFKNAHAWPIVFAENAKLFPDPDSIEVNSKIVLPYVSDPTFKNLTNAEKTKFKDAYIKTYNAYNKLMNGNEQNDQTKKFRAVRALVSGELIFPGFLEENKSKIKPEDFEQAKISLKDNL